MTPLTFRRVAIALLCVPFLIAPAHGQSRSRRRGNARAAAIIKQQREAVIKAAQAKYAQAESLLNVASSNGAGAESRLAAVLGEMQNSVSELKEAKSLENDLKKELGEIESEILREQPSDSQCVRLQQDLQEQRTRLTRCESRIFSAPDYLAKKAELSRAPDAAAQTALLRKDLLDRDGEYATTKAKVDDLATQLATLKRQMFEADSEWKDVHTAMLDARRDASLASTDVYKTAPDRMEPLKDIKNAKQAVIAARSMMADAQTVLRQHNAPVKPTAKSKSPVKK